jgi:hypothetical protein
MHAGRVVAHTAAGLPASKYSKEPPLRWNDFPKKSAGDATWDTADAACTNTARRNERTTGSDQGSQIQRRGSPQHGLRS